MGNFPLNCVEPLPHSAETIAPIQKSLGCKMVGSVNVLYKNFWIALHHTNLCE